MTETTTARHPRFIVKFVPGEAPWQGINAHYIVLDTVGRFTESEHLTRPAAEFDAADLNRQYGS